ncbi:5-aminolevulinate synthase, nonspecific, mitochondrial, partial [Perkinsus olseni]
PAIAQRDKREFVGRSGLKAQRRLRPFYELKDILFRFSLIHAAAAAASRASPLTVNLSEVKEVCPFVARMKGIPDQAAVESFAHFCPVMSAVEKPVLIHNDLDEGAVKRSLVTRVADK